MRKLYAFLLIALFCNAVNAQVGFPDPTFGINGAVSTAVAATGNTTSQLIVESMLTTDGKIVFVINQQGKTRISKRLPNGMPDLAFGKSGFSVTASLVPTAAALQPDGKIVVGGSSDGFSNFMLARYNTNGTLDPTFGNGGIVISDITPSTDFLLSMAITTTGSIITAGNTNGQFTLVAFTANGTLDDAFGNNAIVRTDFNGMGSSINEITLQEDGKIVAAGFVNGLSNYDFALARYHPDGSPDLSFNVTGRTSSDFGERDMATAVVVDKNGKIYAGGNSADLSGFQHFRIARYNSDGSPDKTYNKGAGSLLASFGDSYNGINSIKLQVDGTLIAAGFTNINPPYNDIALTHIYADGTIDNTFGNNGVLLADANRQNDECGFLLIQPDGQILTGGASIAFSQTVNHWFTCFRFNQQGIPDVNFGKNGILLDFIPTTYFSYGAMFEQPDGKLMAVSQVNDGTKLQVFLNRFNKNGTYDNTYGNNSSIELLYQDGEFVFQPDGKLLCITYSPTNNGDLMLVRFNADGNLDAGFGTGGKVVSDFGLLESASQAAFQPDGKILVGGISRDNSGSDWLVVRYNYDGSIDGSFGTNGYIKKNITNDENLEKIIVNADGKITLGGAGFSYPPDFSYFKINILLARLNADGSADKSFGNNGVVIVDRGSNNSLGSKVVQNDGKIVFTYYLDQQNGHQKLVLERLQANGSIDLQFGENGSILPAGSLLQLQPDQKILVMGSELNKLNNKDFSLSRLSKDGQPDISFGTSGRTVVNFTGVDNYFYDGLFTNGAFFTSGSGLDQWGSNVGLVAKFKLEELAVVSCPGNRVVNTDPNLCSAVVYDIDPLQACSAGSTIHYTLTGATIGAGECTASGETFNKGVTTVTYSIGTNAAASCSFTVTVNDNEPPAIENLSTNVTALWPADHKMKDITLNYDLYENCGRMAGLQVTITANEPITTNDWQVVDDHHIRLRAERQQRGSGRIYTITVSATDVSGNHNAKAVNVTVPKNQGPNGMLNVTVQPNPSSQYFSVALQSHFSNKTGDNITVKIFNSLGVLVSTYHNVNANTILKVGDKFVPGIYYLEASQAGIKETLKLVKQ
ncbi:MAG: T9SS type A sorting domain-containing protein [Bacteroidota bacterium]